MTETFGEAYFMDGPSHGLSNYTNYHWLEEPTIAMAKWLIAHMRMAPASRVLDVGCARGYLVKALRLLGMEAWGYDISKWAVTNCDPAISDYVSNNFPKTYFDFVISKDQAEHCRPKELTPLFNSLLAATEQAMLIIVPLSKEKDGPYVRKEDNMDSTHLIRWPLEVWLEYLQLMAEDHGCTVKASWHLPGLKPTSRNVLKSCGFFEIRKVPQV